MEPGDLVYIHKKVGRKKEPRLGMIIGIHDWVSNGTDLLYIFYRVITGGEEIIIAGEFLEALGEDGRPGDNK